MKSIVTKIHEALITKDNIKDAAKANPPEKRFKEFEDVQGNDEGEDYCGKKGKVLFKGTARGMSKLERDGSLFGSIKAGTVEENQNAVLCVMNGGGTKAYTYGADGFLCYE